MRSFGRFAGSMRWGGISAVDYMLIACINADDDAIKWETASAKYRRHRSGRSLSPGAVFTRFIPAPVALFSITGRSLNRISDGAHPLPGASQANERLARSSAVYLQTMQYVRYRTRTIIACARIYRVRAHAVIFQSS